MQACLYVKMSLISLKLGPFFNAKSSHAKHDIMGIFDHKLKMVLSDIVDKKKFTQVEYVKEEKTSKTHTRIFQDFIDHIKTVNSGYPDGTFQWKYYYTDILDQDIAVYAGRHTCVNDQGIISYFFIKITVVYSIDGMKKFKFTINTGDKERFENYYENWESLEHGWQILP